MPPKPRSVSRIIKLEENFVVYEVKILSHSSKGKRASLYISIPRSVAESLDLQRGNLVRVTIRKISEEGVESEGG